MRHISRTYLAIGLLAALVAVAGAAVHSDPDVETKCGIVRTSLEKLGKPTDDAVLLDAAPRAHLLSTVSFEGTNGASLLLRTQGQPLFDHMAIENGRKVVVDVYDTLNGLSGTKFVPETQECIQQVRTSLYALEPRFITRVAIDLAEACEPRFHQEDGLIRIELGPVDKAAEPADKARRLAARLDEQVRRVGVKETGLAEKLYRWNAQQATLEGGLEAEFAAAAELVGDGLRDALAQRLRQAVPKPAAARPASDEAPLPEAELHATQRALSALKGEVRAQLGEHDGRLNEVQTAWTAHAARIRERLAYDLEAVRALETQLTSPEADTAKQAVKTLDVIEAKLDRLAGEDLAAFTAFSESCTAEMSAQAELAGSTVTRLAELKQNAETLLSQGKSAVACGPAPKTAAEPVVAVLTTHAPYAWIAPPVSSAPAVRSATRVAQLTTRLEAVKDAELQLAMRPVTPLAALSDSVFVETVDVQLAQAEPVAEEPVAEAPAEGEPAAESAAVPEEPAAPVTPPAPEPAPPAPPVQPEPEIVVVEPAPKSTVVVTPTPEADDLSTGDITSLNEPVNLDLREMDLSNFVALLARKAGINVIAGTELSGTVTASIRNVPLMQALQMVLRMHDLGIVEEEGVYRIIPYDQAQVAERVTRMVTLDQANVEDVKLTLDNVLMNAPSAKSVSVAANPSTNVIIIAGPVEIVDELETLAKSLDVAKPVTPTVTQAIKLNYALPDEVLTMVKGMLSKEVGQAATDIRGRHVVVTDYPAVVEQVRLLVEDIDKPAKQVAIESTIVDVTLTDAAETGVQWVLNAVQHLNTRGQVIGSLQQGAVGTSLGNLGSTNLDAGLVTFNVLTGDIDFQAAIAAEANSRNAKILATPQLVIVENEIGNIEIVDEFPYQEITQTTQGPPVATTEFKPIGVTLQVTPRVTHTNDIITEVQAKQSSVSGITETGVPIEAKREAKTTLSVKDGQTIFIGGLRRFDDRLAVNKVPVLGDVPILNFLFRNTRGEKVNTELMVFLKCRVLGEQLPVLTAEQQERYDEMGKVPEVPDAQRQVLRSFAKPGEMRDPFWRWNKNNPAQKTTPSAKEAVAPAEELSPLPDVEAPR